MKKRPVFWADIALLLTSKAISLEAIEVMYKGSIFRVYLGQAHLGEAYLEQNITRFFRMTPLPSQQVLSRIQNLDIGTCICHSLDDMDFTAIETWFKKFDDWGSKRNICHLRFPCYYCLFWCEDHTPFFRACRSLVGFKTVIVTLRFHCADADELDEILERYDSMREDFQAALEPHLGPGRSEDDDYSLVLIFHPRKYLETRQAVLPNGVSHVLVANEDTMYDGARTTT